MRTVRVHGKGVVELVEAVVMLHQVLVRAIILAVIPVVRIAVVALFSGIDDAIGAVGQLTVGSAGIGSIGVGHSGITLFAGLHHEVAAAIHERLRYAPGLQVAVIVLTGQAGSTFVMLGLVHHHIIVLIAEIEGALDAVVGVGGGAGLATEARFAKFQSVAEDAVTAVQGIAAHALAVGADIGLAAGVGIIARRLIWRIDAAQVGDAGVVGAGIAVVAVAGFPGSATTVVALVGNGAEVAIFARAAYGL